MVRGMTAPLRDQVRRLADECEERARWSPVGSLARSLLNLGSAQARQAAANRHYSEEDLQAVHRFASAMLAIQGENSGYIALQARQGAQVAAPVSVPTQRHNALNARQLSSLFGMSERGARGAIERGVRRGLEGFFRDGALWLAERDAFGRMRAAKGGAIDPISDTLSEGYARKP